MPSLHPSSTTNSCGNFRAENCFSSPPPPPPKVILGAATSNAESASMVSSTAGMITASDWAKGISLSVLASLVGGFSKLAIRKSWLLQEGVNGQPALPSADADGDEDVEELRTLSSSLVVSIPAAGGGGLVCGSDQPEDDGDADEHHQQHDYFFHEDEEENGEQRRQQHSSPPGKESVQEGGVSRRKSSYVSPPRLRHRRSVQSSAGDSTGNINSSGRRSGRQPSTRAGTGEDDREAEANPRAQVPAPVDSLALDVATSPPSAVSSASSSSVGGGADLDDLDTPEELHAQEGLRIGTTANNRNKNRRTMLKAR